MKQLLIPAATGAVIDVKLFTTDAEFLFDGGSNPVGDGLAWRTVGTPEVNGGSPVPEPSTGLVAALL